MQNGERAAVNEAVAEIAELLAKAYDRYSKIRLITPAEDPLQSTEALDNTGEPSPHEMTLTGRRARGKESAD